MPTRPGTGARSTPRGGGAPDPGAAEYPARAREEVGRTVSLVLDRLLAPT